jgi:branched-chain amino acid transport system substrate-binding protein
MRTRIFFLFLTAIAIASLVAAQCAPPPPTEAPATGEAPPAEAKVLKLGAAVSLTGQVSREGNFLKDGYEFWKEYVNEQGGIDIGDEKYMVEIVYYDDKSDPETSAKLTEKLITEDKVDFILGPYSSGITIATSAIGEKYKKLTLAPLANSPQIYTQGYKYVFSVLPPATKYLQRLLDMAVELDPKPTTIAIMARDDPFGTAVADGVAAHAEEVGLEIVYHEKYPKDATDVSSLLTAIKDKDPDIVVASTLFQDAVLITKQAKDLKVCPKILSFSVGPAIPDYPKEMGADGEYVYGSEWWLPIMGWKGTVFPSAEEYAKMFEEKYEYSPSYHSAGGTATGVILQLALKNAGAVDTEKVREELLKFDEQMFWGPTAWDETGQNIKGASGVIQIQDGKVVSVYPSDIQQAPPKYPMPCWDER